jgi:hypothetical protein
LNRVSRLTLIGMGSLALPDPDVQDTFAGHPSPAGSREEGGGAAWEAAQLRVEDPAIDRGTKEDQGAGHNLRPGDSSSVIPIPVEQPLTSVTK